MSRFRMEFDTDNAAFADGNGPAEVARILRLAADVVDMAVDHSGAGANVRDINGNLIGDWFVDFPDAEAQS